MALAATVTCVAGALASCSGGSGTAHPPAPTPGDTAIGGTAGQGGRSIWMLTRGALAQVAADPTVRARLLGSPIYQLLQPGQAPMPWTGSVPVVTFGSAAEMDHAVTGGNLPPGTKALLYDPEVWSFTPVGEQHNPAAAARAAKAVAQAHGLQLISAPALNLTGVLGGHGGPRWRQFLDLGIIAQMARTSNVIELQAQSLERNAVVYEKFVRAAAAQARRANPRVTVLAGLSTNPPGPLVTSQHLAAVIRATWHVVDGYWLNIPGRGPRCPKCNAPNPEVGRAALRAVL
ncbi:MAG TPA: hypothetical protein VG253_27310 [Streptosporangiaceae bacterium]|nr:hypothetical protein [Streptosporangiaceae bacterium]